jgi:hypothetical protein
MDAVAPGLSVVPGNLDGRRSVLCAEMQGRVSKHGESSRECVSRDSCMSQPRLERPLRSLKLKRSFLNFKRSSLKLKRSFLNLKRLLLKLKRLLLKFKNDRLKMKSESLKFKDDRFNFKNDPLKMKDRSLKFKERGDRPLEVVGSRESGNSEALGEVPGVRGQAFGKSPALPRARPSSGSFLQQWVAPLRFPFGERVPARWRRASCAPSRGATHLRLPVSSCTR